MFYIWLNEGINTQLFFISAIAIAVLLSGFAMFVFPFVFMANKPSKTEERMPKNIDGSFALNEATKSSFSEIKIVDKTLLLKRAPEVKKAKFTIAYMSNGKCISSNAAKVEFKEDYAKMNIECDVTSIDSICVASSPNDSKARSNFVKNETLKCVLMGVMATVAFSLPCLMFALQYSSFFVWSFGHLPEYTYTYYLSLIGLLFGALMTVGAIVDRRS